MDNAKVATAMSYIEEPNVTWWWQNKINYLQYNQQSWKQWKDEFSTIFTPINQLPNAILKLHDLDLEDFKDILEFRRWFFKLLRRSHITEEQAQLSYYQRALPSWI